MAFETFVLLIFNEFWEIFMILKLQRQDIVDRAWVDLKLVFLYIFPHLDFFGIRQERKLIILISSFSIPNQLSVLSFCSTEEEKEGKV